MTKVNTVHWTESSNWTPVDLRDDSPTSSAGKLRIKLFSPTNNRDITRTIYAFCKNNSSQGGQLKPETWARTKRFVDSETD